MPNRDSMIFYRSFYEAISGLPKEDQADIYNAILSYGLNFNEPKLDGVSKTVWTLIKPQIDANIKRYINGKQPKPKRKVSKTEAKGKQNRSKTEANANVNVNDNVNDNVNVKDYSLPEHWRTDYTSLVQYGTIQLSMPQSEIENFFDYYYAKEFTDANGSVIKNWKSALKAWRDKWNDKNKKAELEKPKEEKYFKAGDQYLD